MGKHLIHAEWIGKHATVVSSTNPANKGIQGDIVDETKNTVSIDTPRGVKKVQKRGSVFEINGQTVRGDDALVRPEERIKLKVKQ